MPRLAPSSEQLPLQQDVVDARRLMTVPWVSFFQKLLEKSSSATGYLEGTHDDRITRYPPDATLPPGTTRPQYPPPGTLFWETDRTVLYQSRLVAGTLQWVYLGGTMREDLLNIPIDLDLNDTGFLFYAVDFLRTWRWEGTVWEYAPLERLWAEIAWYPGTVPAGWAVCDGTGVTITLPDASTANLTTPNLVGQFAKGGVYTGAIVPGAAGAITGQTADEAAHTHVVDPPGFFSNTSNLGPIAVQSGTGTNVAQIGHTHFIEVPASGSTAGTAHRHDAGTLSVTGSEPAHMLMLPIVKL